MVAGFLGAACLGLGFEPFFASFFLLLCILYGIVPELR